MTAEANPQAELAALRAQVSELQAEVERLRPIKERAQTLEAQMRILSTNVPLLLLALDRDGVYTFSDGKALEIVGLQPGQLVGMSVFDAFAAFPDFLAAVRKALSGTPANVRTDDTERMVGLDHWLTPIFDAEGRPDGVFGVSIDMTRQIAAEHERTQLQEEIIEAQRAALRELSTPLIPIAENVIAMPLVGSIDTARAQQIMETLLEGIADQQADVAILDITGVRVVDTQVANALLRAAQAAKLLGTRVILTGIRAEVAQTLVGLGADMSSITTAATLQDGVTLALHAEV
jgi:anti-anti-sigma regulatory factor